MVSLKSYTTFIIGCCFIATAYQACSLPESESKRLYEKNCMNCHGRNGEGLRNLYPPLAGSDFLVKNKSRLPCIIRYGMKGEIIVNGNKYHHSMPGNKQLSKTDIHNIVNYINEAWGNEGEYVPLPAIEKQLEKCE